MSDFASDQGITHLAGAVAHAVGCGHRVLRLHQAHVHLALFTAQRLAQSLVNGFDLALILLPPTIPLIIMALAMLAWLSK
ncbi:hypothetical protein, partial [Methyloversatilis discipulorum]|uniref:hypothetical protein n=1 Tax=Methyloversatilis discipulorum TaxID=1119528 RepID=UPI003AF632D7